MQHWHSLIRYPGFLDTSALSNILHTSRLLREEFKCGNIKLECLGEVKRLIRLGLTADHLMKHMADGVIQTAFMEPACASAESQIVTDNDDCPISPSSDEADAGNHQSPQHSSAISELPHNTPSPLSSTLLGLEPPSGEDQQLHSISQVSYLEPSYYLSSLSSDLYTQYC